MNSTQTGGGFASRAKRSFSIYHVHFVKISTRYGFLILSSPKMKLAETGRQFQSIDTAPVISNNKDEVKNMHIAIAHDSSKYSGQIWRPTDIPNCISEIK
eukprot:923575-Ditylum_brightwellii.AAC.1